MSDECIERPTDIGWRIQDSSLALVVRKRPAILDPFHLSVQEMIQSARGRYEMGSRRLAIQRALNTYEQKYPFGHLLTTASFSNALVAPDFLLGQGAYGTTFSGVLTKLNERVIVKIAWENKATLESFRTTQKLHMTTKEGVKAFDQSALREAIISKLVAHISADLPWFSPYYSFHLIPLKFDQVYLETKAGSRRFCPWKMDNRESYPSVFKSLSSDVSLFLPTTPRPQELVATMSMSE